MLIITLGDADRSKPDVDELTWLVLSGGSIEVTWVGNLEGVGPDDSDYLINS